MRKYKFLSIIFYICLFVTSCSSQIENNDSASHTETRDTFAMENEDIVTDNFNVKSEGSLAWQEINTFDKTISYSKIAKTGRISVFILSVWWCGPCKELRDSLSKSSHLSEFIDLYYIDMCAEHEYKELKETDSYFFYRAYDRLKEWPRVIITSQTGSIVKSFSHSDLKRECQERTLSNLVFNEKSTSANINIEELKEKVTNECSSISMYDKSLEIINRLIEFKDKFHIEKNIEQLTFLEGEE